MIITKELNDKLIKFMNGKIDYEIIKQYHLLQYGEVLEFISEIHTTPNEIVYDVGDIIEERTLPGLSFTMPLKWEIYMLLAYPWTTEELEELQIFKKDSEFTYTYYPYTISAEGDIVSMSKSNVKTILPSALPSYNNIILSGVPKVSFNKKSVPLTALYEKDYTPRESVVYKGDLFFLENNKALTDSTRLWIAMQ